MVYTLTLRVVGEITPEDPAYLQFYNTVMRKTMTLLGMEELGRHFYDRHAKIVIRDASLELWPGYITAIRNHEAGVLLCAEVTHKVLRTTTVLALIRELLSKNNMGQGVSNFAGFQSYQLLALHWCKYLW
jgi:aubergine-like protein